MTELCYHLRKIDDIFCKASCFDNCTISSRYNKLCTPLSISEMIYCNEDHIWKTIFKTLLWRLCLGMGLGQHFLAQGWFGLARPSPNWLGLGLGQIQTHSLIDGFGPKFSGPRPIWAGPAQPKSVGPWARPGPNPSLVIKTANFF